MGTAVEDRPGPLLGRSAKIQRVLGLLPKLAGSDATVLIEGETGTGKSCYARALHGASPRAGSPFVVVDCGAIPPTLVENELFGHEKGAFTGAHATREGSFEAAQGGTVLLDEIAELPLDVQPKLLRVLEDRVVKRVGSSETIRIDVRILVATNRDLLDEVARGAFRPDLYYRLDVVRIRIPPLRDRPQDLPLLIQHFYRRCVGDQQADPPHALVEMLCARSWPGNVRQLKSAVERAVLLGEVDLDAARRDADPAISGRLRAAAAPCGPADPREYGQLSYGESKRRMVAGWERSYVTELLRLHHGNIGSAARAARMDRSHLKRLIARHGIATLSQGIS